MIDLIRGTTPHITLRLKNAEGVDLREADTVVITLRQGIASLTKTGNKLEVGEKAVGFYLTQNESMRFKPGPVEIQLNWTFDNRKRAATVCTPFVVKKQLFEGTVL